MNGSERIYISYEKQITQNSLKSYLVNESAQRYSSLRSFTFQVLSAGRPTVKL